MVEKGTDRRISGRCTSPHYLQGRWHQASCHLPESLQKESPDLAEVVQHQDLLVRSWRGITHCSQGRACFHVFVHLGFELVAPEVTTSGIPKLCL